MTIERLTIGSALPMLSDLARGMAVGSGADRRLQAELVAERGITHQVEQEGERRAGIAWCGWLACHSGGPRFKRGAQRVTQLCCSLDADCCH